VSVSVISNAPGSLRWPIRRFQWIYVLGSLSAATAAMTASQSPRKTTQRRPFPELMVVPVHPKIITKMAMTTQIISRAILQAVFTFWP
jgi:hypothetical protein